MKTIFPRLSTQGLIAAAIATIASPALAEQAGRVHFVNGAVKAISPDGKTRTLTRGAVINGGDRIETGLGRLQIRFTDGGFVSLQPNSVFGVDQYLYANKKPEETSLFFSLLQGGMRTITGSIGKVNKQSYKVRTPVATIGIRGTEYVASMDKGRLLVSVGAGFVNVANAAGELTGGAGQNIQALDNLPPLFTNEDPDVSASSPKGDNKRLGKSDDDTRDEDNGSSRRVVTSGDIFEQASLRNLPAGSNYRMVTLQDNDGIIQSSGYDTFKATFDQNGAPLALVSDNGPSPGGLKVIGNDGYVPPVWQQGTLKFVNVGTAGSVSWGEYTDGQAATLFSDGSTEPGSPYSDAPSFANNGQYLAYVIGKGYNEPLVSGKARYSLVGATPARLNGGAVFGKLEKLDITLNTLVNRADIDMSIKGQDYELRTNETNREFYGAINFGNLTTRAVNNDGSTYAGSNSICGGSGSTCNTNILGFLSGDKGNQIGLTYLVQGASDKVSGAAALGLSGFLSSENQMLTFNNSEGVFSANNNDDMLVVYGSDGRINSLTTYSNGSERQYTPNGDTDNPVDFVNRKSFGTLQLGEMTDGTTNTDNLSFMPTVITADQFLPYIIGNRTEAGYSGRATYSLNTATAARINGNNDAASVGTLEKLNLTLNTNVGTADVDMLVNMQGFQVAAKDRGLFLQDVRNGTGFNLNAINTVAYQENSSGQLILNGGSPVQVDSGSVFCASGCSTDITGFFSGKLGETVGLTYSVNDNISSNKIIGAAALSTNVANVTLPQSGYTLLTATDNASTSGAILKNYAGNVSALLKADKTIDFLSAENCIEGCYNELAFQPGDWQAQKTGSSTYLVWGQYSNGNADTGDNYSLPNQLGANEFTSYILGKGGTGAALAGLTKASYSLQGAGNTSQFKNTGDGTYRSELASFDLELDLLRSTLDLDVVTNLYDTAASSTTPTEKLTVSGRDLNINSFSVDGRLKQDNLFSFNSNSEENSLSVSSDIMEGGVCVNGCSAEVRGFIAGDGSEIGSNYAITTNAGSITGVAQLELTQTSSTSTSFTDGNRYTISAVGPGVPMLHQAATVDFNAAGGVQSANNNTQDPAIPILQAGVGVTATEVTTNKTLSWGRLGGSSVQDALPTTIGVAPVALGQSVAYIVGTQTSNDNWNSMNYDNGNYGRTATYTVSGSTSAKGSDGSVGSIDSSFTKMTLNLGSQYLDVQMRVTMGETANTASTTYQATGGQNLNGPSFNELPLTTTANGAACASGCSTSVSGFFSGGQAQQAGMGYFINDNDRGRSVNGAVAFDRTNLSAPIDNPRPR